MASRKSIGAGPTEAQILDALSKVQEPELHQDLVSLKMIRDVSIQDGKVSCTLVLTTPACPLRAQISAEVKQAIEAVPGVREAHVRVESSVPSGQNRGQVVVTARNTIAVASGKGGVGKSTLAVNLAVALAQRGSCVGLLDADIYGPNLPRMMGIQNLPAPTGDRILPAEAHGVKVMSIGFMVAPGQPLIWRGPMLHSVIRQFLTDVEWGDLDYLVIDLPPGTGDVQLSLSQLIPLSGGLIVTLPQKVSVEDARRGLEMFRVMDIPVLGVVENISFWRGPDGSEIDLFGRGGGKQLAEETGVSFLGEIPVDASVRIHGDSGTPIVLDGPESAVAAAFRGIAEQVAARISVLALTQSEKPAVPENTGPGTGQE
jgi:ATP-binding protein involved in chromosome partitioning